MEETYEVECQTCKVQVKVNVGVEPELEEWSLELSWKCPKCGKNHVKILTPS